MVKQDSPHLTLLKQELLKWEAFNRISQSTDYQQHLKPLLTGAFNNKWPDPAQQDFDRKYIIEYSRAMAYKEIFDILDTAQSMIKNLNLQLALPEKNLKSIS
jgi:hypothetical protein